MKTLKVILQEVVSGLKSWVNTSTVHKTGNETINGVKTFSDGIVSDVTGSATSVPWTGVTGKPSDFTPSSHTHGNISNDGKIGTTANQPLITGTGGAITAGTFGNQANTFCEGNDSRLSDARTPVAHTHGKADITDLFNSANEWTGDNTYSKTVAIERSTDTGNFLALKNTVAELGSTPASATPVTIAYRDKNNDNLGYMGVYYDTDGSNLFRLYVRNKFTSGSPSTSGLADYAYFGLKLNADKSKEGILKASFRPYDNNTYGLGSSSYKWKTLNGINPGALSLPDTLGTSGTENVNYFNVIGYLNNTGTLATIPAAATYDGWLYINAKDGADSYIMIDDYPASFGTSVFGNNGLGSNPVGLLCLICPIRAGHSYNVRIKSAGIVSARIYPAQGNV